MKLSSEFKALTDPVLRLSAIKCLAWRLLLIPFLAVAIPFFILQLLGDFLKKVSDGIDIINRPVGFILDKIRAEYQTARELRQVNRPQRCAECDCENGGTDCNWIATPKETDHA